MATTNSNFCPSCLKDTAYILDHTVGHKLCSECGFLLLESNHDDEEAPDSPVSDENRDHQNLESIRNLPITNVYDDVVANDSFVKIIPKKGLKLIDVMAKRLELGTAIIDRARAIYNEVDVLKTCRGRSMNSIVAACLFIACRDVKYPRTLKEISDVADGASKKGINRAIEAIKKRLDVETWTVQPTELVRRFCSKLGMENNAIKAVQEALQNTQVLDIRRSPQSVLAVIIYMVMQLSDDQKPVKGIYELLNIWGFLISSEDKFFETFDCLISFFFS